MCSLFFSVLASVAFFSTTIASPIASDDTLAKRGNGAEIFYITTCNGEPHGSTAAYYSNWQDSQTYGAHRPNAYKTSVNLIGETGVWPGAFDGATFQTDFSLYYDPGWYQVAGHASKGSTSFTCRMDNGRQLFDDCFSNYYCQ